jgi:B9 domain-containing protein 2
MWNVCFLALRVEAMAEVHILGTLEGASEFPNATLCCKWSAVTGEGWSLLEGHASGQTHVDTPLDPSMTIWNHPIGSSDSSDLHYNTKSIAGWPKIVVRVFHQDTFGRNILCNLF